MQILYFGLTQSINKFNVDVIFYVCCSPASWTPSRKDSGLLVQRLPATSLSRPQGTEIALCAP